MPAIQSSPSPSLPKPRATPSQRNRAGNTASAHRLQSKRSPSPKEAELQKTQTGSPLAQRLEEERRTSGAGDPTPPAKSTPIASREKVEASRQAALRAEEGARHRSLASWPKEIDPNLLGPTAGEKSRNPSDEAPNPFNWGTPARGLLDNSSTLKNSALENNRNITATDANWSGVGGNKTQASEGTTQPAQKTEVDRYKAWQSARDELVEFEKNKPQDPFKQLAPEYMGKKMELQTKVGQAFSEMAPKTQKLVYESEREFQSWKQDFQAQAKAEAQESHRASLYKRAGLDPDKPVSDNKLISELYRADDARSRQQLQDDITAIPNLLGNALQGAADSVYAKGRAEKSGDEGFAGNLAKDVWNTGLSGAHMLGHVGGSLTKTGGEMAAGAASVVVDPAGAAGRFVDARESSRKAIGETLKSGGAADHVGTEAHAAVLSYLPGAQNLGEGISNVSLESTTQTQAWKNRSATERVTQTAAGVAEFAGTAAGVSAGVSKAATLLRPKSLPSKALLPGVNTPTQRLAKVDAKRLPDADLAVHSRGKAPLASRAAASRNPRPARRAKGREYEPDFMGGKTSKELATKNARDLGLAPNAKVPGFNSVPESWLPKYVKTNTHPKTGKVTRKFNEALTDVWGKTRGPQDHAALAAQRVVKDLNKRIAAGDAPTGKYHWKNYGDSPKEAAASLDRLKKIYQLQDAKVKVGNPTARARANVFDAIRRWAEASQ